MDAAKPGDTIIVRPGVYAGDTVRVNTSRLTIRGSRGAIIDASGHDFGLTVGPAPNIPPDCGTGYGVSDFTIDGLTIRNAEDTGIFLMGVNRFRVTGGSYLNNGEYGIFPRCSRDGLVDHNSGGGGDDATIYVGVDKNIRVERNVLTNGVLGIELEDTDDTYVRNNVLTGNTIGVFVIVLPGLPTTSTNRARRREQHRGAQQPAELVARADVRPAGLPDRLAGLHPAGGRPPAAAVGQRDPQCRR